MYGNGKGLLAAALALAVAACGGGGDDSVPAGCTPLQEKRWALAHLQDVYLWYREMVGVSPADYDRVESYFAALLVKPKDRFSFVTGQAAMDAFQTSGRTVGYGVLWSYDAASANALRADFVEPSSPAAAQGVRRGDVLLSLNGLAVRVMDFKDVVKLLNPVAGERVDMELSDLQGGPTRSVTLAAGEFVQQPVPQVSVLTMPDGRRVGYLLFNDHIFAATEALSAAILQFQTAGVSDVVLDLRFNGGGFLSVASQLAYMLSGPASRGQVFSRLHYNDKHAHEDWDFPVLDYDHDRRPLPYLSLSRVYAITDSRTCSASENVINSLRSFLPVYLIGSPGCGKPYGFEQTNFCDKAYFAVRFKGTNRLGDSIPETGFAVECPAADTGNMPLGHAQETMLSTALALQQTGTCPSGPLFRRMPQSPQPLPREPWRENLLAP